MFNERLGSFVIGGVVIAMGAGCASTAIPEDASQHPATGTAASGQCIAASPERWEPRSATELIMWSHPDGRPYRIDLSVPCFRLMFAEDVSFSLEDGQLCDRGRDSVTINRSRFDRYGDDLQTPQTCVVRSITALDGAVDRNGVA